MSEEQWKEISDSFKETSKTWREVSEISRSMPDACITGAAIGGLIGVFIIEAVFFYLLLFGRGGFFT